MSIPFLQIPNDNRVPGTGVEFDGTFAGTSASGINERILVIGQMTVGMANLNKPVTVANRAEGVLFGENSQIADQVRVVRKNSPNAQIIGLPLDNSAAGLIAASGGIDIGAGPATQDGALVRYIGGRRYAVSVFNGDTTATILNNFASVVAVDPHAKVENLTVSGTQLLFDAVAAGAAGNTISIVANQLGDLAGEFTPAGLSDGIIPMAGGVGAPNLTAALTALGTKWVDRWASAYADAVSLNAIEFAMNPLGGRWAWNVKAYGECYAAYEATLGGALTYGQTRNSPYVSIMPVDGMRNPSWEWAAAYAAQQSRILHNSPAAATYRAKLQCIWKPERPFEHNERQQLYHSGNAGFYVNDGDNGGDQSVHIDLCCSTYQRNAANATDDGWLLMNTTSTLMAIARHLDFRAQQVLHHRILVDDGELIEPGSNKISAPLFMGVMVAAYKFMQTSGWVENLDAFIANLVAQKNPNNPNRLDVLWAGDLANPLLQINYLIQFRQQYMEQFGLAA